MFINGLFGEFGEPIKYAEFNPAKIYICLTRLMKTIIHSGITQYINNVMESWARFVKTKIVIDILTGFVLLL